MLIGVLTNFFFVHFYKKYNNFSNVIKNFILITIKDRLSIIVILIEGLTIIVTAKRVKNDKYVF